MFEKKHQPLISHSRFIRRMFGFIGVAAALDGTAVLIGAVGFRLLEKTTWPNALVNAAFVITGNGPINEIQTAPARAFAAFYALSGGIVFAAVVGVLLVPVFHRVLHSFHLEAPDKAG
jgi:hypothetical protein